VASLAQEAQDALAQRTGQARDVVVLGGRLGMEAVFGDWPVRRAFERAVGP
jgi:hypothetical protein